MLVPDQPQAIQQARGLAPLPKTLNQSNAKATVARLVASEKIKDEALAASEKHHKFIQDLHNKKAP